MSENEAPAVEVDKQIVNAELQGFIADLHAFFIEHKNHDSLILQGELLNMNEHLKLLLDQIDIRRERISLFNQNESFSTDVELESNVATDNIA
jgi:hypothetical protein